MCYFLAKPFTPQRQLFLPHFTVSFMMMPSERCYALIFCPVLRELSQTWHEGVTGLSGVISWIWFLVFLSSVRSLLPIHKFPNGLQV